MRTLLVTNDFPPKVGGIQSYLWELWRRLPPDDVAVLTTSFDGSEAWDAAQPFTVHRVSERLMLPTPSLARRIRAVADREQAGLVFLDPALPLGALGPRLGLPYVVVAHGAEVTVYGRVPPSSLAMRWVLRRAAGVVAAGGYPAREAVRTAGRDLPGIIVPPGVDTVRFAPQSAEQRTETRRRFGLDAEAPLVVGVSRLVPRKGFDVVIDAMADVPDAHLAIAGSGRDRERLERRARGLGARMHFLGRVPDEDLPALYAAADVFAMACRDRWGGLEAEGFGIVFLEAAASGVPCVAGRSGGSHEAVADGETGFVVSPRDVATIRDRIGRLLGDAELRRRMGRAARERAVAEFSYDHLAARLAPVAAGDLGALGVLEHTP